MPFVCWEIACESGLRTSTAVRRDWFRCGKINCEIRVLLGIYGAFSAFVAVDGTKFVAGGAVLFLFGYGGQVGYMVGGGHGDQACP